MFLTITCIVNSATGSNHQLYFIMLHAVKGLKIHLNNYKHVTVQDETANPHKSSRTTNCNRRHNICLNTVLVSDPERGRG